MKTVGELIKELEKFPKNSLCWAYEGESTGIAIRNNIGDPKHGFIYCSEGEDTYETDVFSS